MGDKRGGRCGKEGTDKRPTSAGGKSRGGEMKRI